MSVVREITCVYKRSGAFTTACNRSSEDSLRATGDFSVGLPAKARRWGIFMSFLELMSAMSAQRHSEISKTGSFGFMSMFCYRFNRAVRPEPGRWSIHESHEFSRGDTCRQARDRRLALGGQA